MHDAPWKPKGFVMLPCCQQAKGHVRLRLTPVRVHFESGILANRGLSLTVSRSDPLHKSPMQAGTQRALEFDRIVEAVAGYALTPMGRERLTRLQPSVDPSVVAHALAATTETARYVSAHGTF